MKSLVIAFDGKAYALPHGQHTQGGTLYHVDHRGIVKQTNFSTENIYTDNSVDGKNESDKIINAIEVKGLARSVGIQV